MRVIRVFLSSNRSPGLLLGLWPSRMLLGLLGCCKIIRFVGVVVAVRIIGTHRIMKKYGPGRVEALSLHQSAIKYFN